MGFDGFVRSSGGLAYCALGLGFWSDACPTFGGLAHGVGAWEWPPRAHAANGTPEKWHSAFD